MMTKPRTPPPAISDAADPYRIRTLEQLFMLFDGGEFVAEVLEKHEEMQRDMLAYRDTHGSKGCTASMVLRIDYALNKTGDVNMGAKAEFKSPKKPPASASAYVGEDGQLTLYSPLLRRMTQPVRDVTRGGFDPETGEIRDL